MAIDINFFLLLLLLLFCVQGNLIMSDIGLAEKRVYHAALNGNNSLPSVLHQKDD
jgi:lysophosphatidylcholine acyltransferase/lyso-PAF acetyltransferase